MHPESHTTIDLRRFAQILRRQAGFIIGVALCILALVAGFTALQPTIYEATAVLELDLTAESEGSASVRDRERQLSTEVEFLRSSTVWLATADRLEEEPSITIHPSGHADIVSISATDSSPTAAAAAAAAHASAYLELRSTMLRRDDPTIGEPVGWVITPAEVPDRPVSPDLVRNGAIGMMIALVVAICAAVARDVLDDTIRDEEHLGELDLGLPVLAVIPVRRRWRRLLTRPIGRADLPPILLEAIRTLRTSVNFLRSVEGRRSFLVTSVASGDGKSTVVANLGVELAREERDVIVVDGDLRRPTQHQRFGIARTPGLSDVADGEVSEIEAEVDPPVVPSPTVLPAGTPTSDPASALGRTETDGCFERLNDAHDLVLVDGPPLEGTSDALVLSQHADATLVVVRSSKTSVRSLRTGLDRLKRSGARVEGLILVGMPTGKLSGYDTSYLAAPLEPAPLDEPTVEDEDPAEGVEREPVLRWN